MTADEVERLLAVADQRRKLVYRIALGTGLRSTELSLLVPNQINFKKNTLTIEAEKTKNKKADMLPMRPDLVQAVKEWCELHGIEPQSRIFGFNSDSIRRSFYADLKKAAIDRIGADGRSIDVHSLRKTFGTMLANAGVPLTTTQRLMRHSTPLLTAKLYIDVEGVDMMQALEKLPEFS
jgi:integrase